MTQTLAVHAETLRFRTELLSSMVKREVLGRYRGSLFGVFWSLISPLLMLGVYTLAFHELFGARWPGSESRSGFAVMAFVGLIVHGLLAETLARAPGAIAGQPNFVKKLVFPLTVLPLVSIGTALFHAMLGFMVLVGFSLLLGPPLHWTAVLVPLFLVPYVVGLCGLAWGLSAFGVYVRDISQLSGLVSTMLMFLSPVFYPLSAVPAKYVWLVQLNPLTLVIETVRALLFAGTLPPPGAWTMYCVAALLAAVVGLGLFRKLRPGFGDVL